MAQVKLEYIWLDGYTPEPNLRSKTKVWSYDGEDTPAVEDLPMWSFDGSSTQQAEGSSSDCHLKPVAIIPDPGRLNAFLVLTEVLTADGSVHPSNTRGGWADDTDMWFGFEQEYFLMKDGQPLGFPKGQNTFPAPQGPYYCAVGSANVNGREIVEEHLDICLEAGLAVTGINAEVALGQWEYQLFGKGAKLACDNVWFSRYLLIRTAEQYGVDVEFHPKPLSGDWNGSGMHCNFSNTFIREEGGEAGIKALLDKFAPVHEEHIAEYGSCNELRLTGSHETQSIDQFSYGVSDRGASIRIPLEMTRNDWKGYVEDRRPASNADPYRVAARILKTVNS